MSAQSEIMPEVTNDQRVPLNCWLTLAQSSRLGSLEGL